jgi:arginine decarboxylase
MEPEVLAGAYRRKLAAAGLPAARSAALLAELEAGLYGYTYLS